jgi:HK97 family phage prohead protease
VTVLRLRVEASAPVAVDRSARTVRGLAVPWATPALVQGVGLPVMFLRGSLEVDERARLLRAHDPDLVVGRPVWWGDHDTGLRAGFKISRTPAGNDVLDDAEDRIRDGLSIGADLFDVDEAAGLLVVRGAVVREVSLVGMPAFASARLE